MKILHTADLHIGKSLNGVSLIEDQQHILNEILNIALEQSVSAIIVAGDVFDRSIPSTEAIDVLDCWLNQVSKSNIKMYMISGNHDSVERLNFASKLLQHKDIYICSKLHGEMNKGIELEKFSLTEDNTTVNVYMLPFVRPSFVKHYYPDETITDFHTAINTILSHINVNSAETNILVTHQFVTSHSGNNEYSVITSDSESRLSVGGTVEIDCQVFNKFDYTALGHLHREQSIINDNIRYAGSPLKYSFSEVTHKKSVTIIEIPKNNKLIYSFIPLHPLRDMRIIENALENILDSNYVDPLNHNDFICGILTDKHQLLDAMTKLKTIYPNALSIQQKYNTINPNDFRIVQNVQNKTLLELFEDFYLSVHNTELSNTQKDIVIKALNTIDKDIMRNEE